MKKVFLGFIVIIVILLSCNTVEKNKNSISTQESLVYATIWFQNSPEMQACYYQGFNLAKERVNEIVKTKSKKPKAVVVDIDETMLDNSAFQAQQIFDSKSFTSEFWKEWTDLAKATALPGAIEFSRYCDSLGVEVFYISNRKINEIRATLKNLDSLGFAFAKEENMLFKEDVSSKKVRRDKISEKYEIVLLIGDNLNDLSEVFENRGNDWGTSTVEKYKMEFGKRFIILPNPMYGDWEKNVYGGKRDLTEEQKSEARKKALKGFK